MVVATLLHPSRETATTIIASEGRVAELGSELSRGLVVACSVGHPDPRSDRAADTAIDSYRIFFAASPDMTAEIHDMVAAGDKVAIRATYRGTDKGGFIPEMPATGKTFAMEAMYMVRINDEGQIAEHWGVVEATGQWPQPACRHVGREVPQVLR